MDLRLQSREITLIVGATFNPGEKIARTIRAINRMCLKSNSGIKFDNSLNTGHGGVCL